MSKETALSLLNEVVADQRFVGYLAHVSVYGSGRTPHTDYWCIRVACLGGTPPGWTYVETPGDFNRMRQEVA